MAAPLVAAGASAVLGATGAAALGSATGIAIMASLFGAAGAGLTGQFELKLDSGALCGVPLVLIDLSQSLTGCRLWTRRLQDEQVCRGHRGI